MSVNYSFMAFFPVWDNTQWVVDDCTGDDVRRV